MSGIAWNIPIVQEEEHRGVFFSPESYRKFSCQPSFSEYLKQKDKELWSISSEIQVEEDNNASENKKKEIKSQETDKPLAEKPSSPPTKTTDNNERPCKTVCLPEKDGAVKEQATDKSEGSAAPGLNTFTFRPKVPYPRTSWLNHDEQTKYLELFQKYSNYVSVKPTPEEIKEVNFLKELQIKVSAEQEEFMQYLEKVASQSSSDYDYIHRDVKKYMQEYQDSQRSRVKSYPRHYIQYDTVPLIPPRAPRNIIFTHEKTLLEMGIVPKTILPKFDTPHRPQAPTSHAKISGQYPATGESKERPTRNKTCSCDLNASQLASKYGADIVISSSGLKCLFDNAAPHYPRQWELPIVVKEEQYENEKGELVKKKVVYVDKPFVPKHPNKRELNTRLYKLSLKCFLLHPKHMKARKLGLMNEAPSIKFKPDVPLDRADNRSKRELHQDTNFFEQASNDDMSQLEIFGVEDKNYLKPSKRTGTSTPDITSASPSAVRSSKANEQSMSDDRMSSGRPKSLITAENRLDQAEKISVNNDASNSPATPPINERSGSGHDDNRTKGSHIGAAESIKQPADSESTSPIPAQETERVDINQSTGNSEEIKQKAMNEGAGTYDLVTPSTSVPSVQPIKSHPVPRRSSSRLQRLPQPTPGDKETATKSSSQVSDSDQSDMDISLTIDTGDCDMKGSEKNPRRISPRSRVASKTSTTSIPLQKKSPDDKLTRSSACTGRNLYKSLDDVNDLSSEDDAILTIDLGEEPAVRSPVKTRSSVAGEKSKKKNSSKEMKRKSGQLEKVDPGSDETDMNAEQPLETPRKRTRALSSMTGKESTETIPVSHIKTRSGRIIQSHATKEKNEYVELDGGIQKEIVPENSDLQVQSTPVTRSKGKSSIDECKTTFVCESDRGSLPDSTSSTIGLNIQTRLSVKEASQTKEFPYVLKTADTGGLPVDSKNIPGTADAPVPKCIPLQKTSVEVDTHKSQDIPATAVKDKDTTYGILKRPLPKIEPPSRDRIPKRKKIVPRKQRESATEQTVGISPLDTIIQGQDKLYQMGKSATADSAKSETKREDSTGPLTAGQLPWMAREQGVTPSVIGQKDPSDWIMKEDSSAFTEPHTANVTYNTWRLGNMKLLLRCGIHGIRSMFKAKLENYVEIQPKLEYQLKFGLEQTTYSEAARAWVALYTRNNCELVRARVNPRNSEIVRVDTVDLQQCVPPRSGFSPLLSINVVHDVLERLTKLDVGHYILSHTPGNPHAQIKKTTQSSKGVYDLHLAYMKFSLGQGTPNMIPWVPIDPTLLMPYHKRFGRIPATYDPKVMQPNLYKDAQQKKQPGQKKKGKKKKGKKRK